MNRNLLLLFLLPFLFVFCEPPGQEAVKGKLDLVDDLLEENPKVAEDSLSGIREELLNKSNLAYYRLLSVIADDKLYHGFKSDSLISEVVKEYRKTPLNENYFRALVYQGIVRYKVDYIPDSMVFVSLKKAEKLLASVRYTDSEKTLIKLWTFLGLLHENNQNIQLSETYYKKALKVAIEIGDNENIVASSLALFWNYLRENRLPEIENVFQVLDSLKNISPELKYDIINARSGFYMVEGEYPKALIGYGQLDSLASLVKEKPRLSNIYYSMSVAYRGMGRLDSAIFYARKSIESICDSAEILDYYDLHAKLAELDYQAGIYKEAALQYKNAFALLKNSTKRKTQKRILELEKRYDLSQAKIETLKQKQKYQRLVILAAAVLTAIIFVLLIYYLNLKKSRIQLENEKLLRVSAEKEVAGKIRENQQRKHLIKFYQLITQREMVTQQRFDLLSQKYVKDDPDTYTDLQTELGILKEEFSGMMYDLMNDDLFYSNIDLPTSFPLSNVEKVMLLLLYYEIPSNEIAAVLGISTNNFRVKKSYLKRRIVEELSNNDTVNFVLALF
jgi:tetratricopeptide (TPR) repeat protein